MHERATPRLRPGQWLLLAASLAGLNLALSFHNVWPTPWVTSRHELSVEVCALLFGLALWVGRRGVPARRWLGLLAGVLLVLTLGRYAEVTAPSLYGRPINLYWDAQHMPRVAAMLAGAAPAWLTAAALLGVAAVLALLLGTLGAMLGCSARAMQDRIARRLVLMLCGVLLCAYAAGHVVPGAQTLRYFSLPVTMTYAQQLRFVHRALGSDDAARIAAAAPLPAAGLTAVSGADVVLLFLESYGATTFDQPRYAQALQPVRERLAAALRSSGRQAVSALVRSPTFGGASWLAHSSLLSGLQVADNGYYNLLLTGQRDTLIQRFASHGYRTLAVMPGLRQAWPEGAFYGFDQIYDAAALDYRGPAFGWWRIPDQYALARLDALELRPRARAPVLAFFPTISTHMPFRPTPPYQPDWQALLGPRPYADAAVADSLARHPDWTDLGAGYIDAVHYALDSLAGYLAGPAPSDLVLVVLGDHQPAASVTGPGASWDVPVHVIASRPALLAALRQGGFVDGLQPGRPAVAAMHELTLQLLRAFDAPAARMPAASAAAAGSAAQPRVDVAGTAAGRQAADDAHDVAGRRPVLEGKALRFAG